MPENDPAKKWFQCTDAERAAFEAGIKLGALYHQFVGTAVDADGVEALERAMEASLSAQPFVRGAVVRLERERLKGKGNAFGYLSVTGDMIDASVTVKYGAVTVSSRLEYVPELDYPLMYVESVLG